MPPTTASSMERPTRVESIRAASPSGPQGSAAAGDQQAITAALDELPVAVLGQVGMTAAGCASRSRRRAVGLEDQAHQVVLDLINDGRS
jgi:hypothetical protein